LILETHNYEEKSSVERKPKSYVRK